VCRYNFDHPDAIDQDMLVEHLWMLKQQQAIEIPVYDFSTHSRVGTQSLAPADIVILDGIFILAVARIRKACDLAVFTMEDSDVCLARRLRRDMKERGRTLDSVLLQYERFVKPGFQAFIQPTMSKADVIIPRARDNHKAILMLARDLAMQVLKRKKVTARQRFSLPSPSHVASGGGASSAPESPLPHTDVPTESELADALVTSARSTTTPESSS